jgi:hypothetical protein
MDHAQHSRDEFTQALLADVAPDETPLYATYSDALAQGDSSRRAGVGFGIPPEMMGVIGIAAVAVGHVIFDLILDWAKGFAGEILRKYVVDTGVEKLKAWLGAPKETDLGGTLTAEGRLAVLAVVEKEAAAAGLSATDIVRLKESVLKRLGIL